MSKPFRCQLFPNTLVEPSEMQYPLIASYKLDGIRALFIDGEMLSRSGKPIPNKQLQEKYNFLKVKSKTLGVIFDGELYDHSLKRNEIASYVMAHDKEIPDSLEFWCFDMFDPEEPEQTYNDRVSQMIEYTFDYDNVRVTEWFFCADSGQVRTCMDYALKDGYEGLILLSPTSTYKQGRITIPSGDGYKMKPYVTFDSRIVGVVQAAEVNPEAPKKINELGYSETSKKKGDRIPVEKAAAFEVLWFSGMEYKTHKEEMTGEELAVGISDGHVVKVTLAMTDAEKEEVWVNRESYLGKYIEWKGLAHGMKDVPSHPTFVRFREDLDD